MVVLAALFFVLFFVLIIPGLAIYAAAKVREQGREFRQLSEHTYRLLTQRVYDLEAKVRLLEAQLAGDRPSEPAAVPDAPRAAPAPVPATAVATSAPAPFVPAREASGLPPATTRPAPTPMPALGRLDALDWESLIAGRWLNVIGIAALLLATAFFLRYAFESDWIGPAGRVVIGLVAGTGLLAGSERLFRSGYAFFSDGLAGLGGGVLYLSLYAAWGYYQLLPQPAAFGGMAAVTLMLMLLAAGRRSERIALVALAGGFAAPLLLRTGTDQQIVLFSYVGALDAGALALASFRQWRVVPPAAFAGTQLLFWGWYIAYWDLERLIPTAVFATLFFLLFGAASFDGLRRGGTAAGHLVLVLSNAFAYLFALRAMLWPTHRWALTVAVLALAATHLAVARLVVGPHDLRAAGVPLVRIVYAGLALTFATLAVPIRLEGRWITIAWAIEGAVLVWSGFASRLRPLRAAGLVLLAIALVRLLAFPIDADRFLLNPRFLTWVTVAVALVVVVWFARSHREDTLGSEQHVYRAAAVAASLLFVWALTADTWAWIGGMDRPLGLTPGDLRQLALPFIWTTYGTALVVAGFSRQLPGLRWMGLPFVGMAAGALLVQTARPEVVLMNPRLAAYLLAAACVLSIGRLARRAVPPVHDAERLLYRITPVVFNLLLIVALSHEVWDIFGLVRTAGDVRYAQTMGLSILWAGYATALIGAGVRTAEPLLRWMALLLFGVVVIKVFFFDLSALDRGYRILSFFVLGVLLLAVSFLYTRRLAAARSGGSA